MSSQSGTTYGDRFVFRGDGTGDGDNGDLYCFTRHFTDAQIKALPTTSLEILPAPGVNYTWHVVDCLVAVDSASAPYGNIDPDAYISIDDVGRVGNDASLGLADCSILLGTAGHQLVALRREWLTELTSGSTMADIQAAGWGVRPQVVTDFIASGENVAVMLMMDNGASGVLASGDTNNSLLVRTLAMRIPGPTLWAALYS